MDVPEQKTAGDNTPQTTRPGEGGYEQVENRDVIESGYTNDADLESGVGDSNDPGLLSEQEVLSGDSLDDDELADDIAGEDVDHNFVDPDVTDDLEDDDEYDLMNQDDIPLEEGEEPDFAGDAGTTDMTMVVEEGETYFPPTDPVLGPSVDSLEGVEVLNGFATTSLEGPTDVEQVPGRLHRGDDELANDVIAALRNDAYTTDLNVEVEVVDGVVYLRGQVQSLEDVEQVEEVAGRVNGILDVEEQLDIV